MLNDSRILVVDDEAVIRELLCDILTDDGYPVESMPSGPTALNLIRSRDDIVLLFTDIMMPEMDGIQLIREARKIRPSLIPIVMTGFATVETARAAVKEGAYDYVLKPFSLSEVKMAVANAIERHRLSDENARLRELAEIFDISEAMASIRDERELLDFVLHAALRHVGADRGSIMLTTPDGSALEVAASIGLPHEASFATVPVGKGISGRVAHSGQPLLVADLIDHPELHGDSRKLADRSFVSVPLINKRPRESGVFGPGPRTVAVLNVCSKQDGTQFSPADLKMLNVVANHAAAAIHNVRSMRDSEQAHLVTVQRFVDLTEEREGYLRGHSNKVREVALLLARHLGLNHEQLDALRLITPLHDIGRSGIPHAVLAKDGPLTDSEWQTVRRHPIIGIDLLRTAPMLKPIHLDVARSHHERFDGTGYPDGLRGEQIPPLARIVSIADACIAMSSDRPYRGALGAPKIADEIRNNRGTQFDPHYADTTLDLIANGKIQ